jgi:hypothetical protein
MRRQVTWLIRHIKNQNYFGVSDVVIRPDGSVATP